MKIEINDFYLATNLLVFFFSVSEGVKKGNKINKRRKLKLNLFQGQGNEMNGLMGETERKNERDNSKKSILICPFYLCNRYVTKKIKRES